MIIYLIRSLEDGKAYVGQTIGKLSTRWSVHKSAARCGSKQKIHSAIRKYGEKRFTIEIIGSAPNQEQLDYLEQYFIVLFNSDNTKHGYNRTMGGLEHFNRGNKFGLGRKNDDSTKRKMSVSAKLSWTPERKAAVSARAARLAALRMPKLKSPRKIRTHFPKLTEEHKRKISISLVGNKRRLGIPHTPECRASMSKKQRNLKRKPRTPVHLRNMRLGRLRSKIKKIIGLEDFA